MTSGVCFIETKSYCVLCASEAVPDDGVCPESFREPPCAHLLSVEAKGYGLG